MAIKWSDLRDSIRIAILRDIPPVTTPQDGSSAVQFEDDQLLVAARWACAALSMHTAQRATKEYNGDGRTNQFDLPDDMVDGVEKAALVIYRDQVVSEFLPPLRLIPNERWDLNTPTSDAAITRSYWEWPHDTMTLSFIPANGSVIEIRYYKIWTAPESDESILEFPRAFEQPFAYFVGAMAFDPLSAQASSIRQWNRRSDSGTPEDNPLQRQAEYFLKQADARLKAIGPQDRETFYRVGHRDFGMGR